MTDEQSGVSLETLRLLAAPFKAHEVSWRINRAGTRRDKPDAVWALAVPYLQSDAIFDRLDTTVGPGMWQTDVRSGPGHVYVGIGILTERGWVWKWDGTGLMESNDGLSQQDAGKGDVTNGVKRAAVQWGIGRYLREVREKFVDTFPANSDDGKFYASKGKNHPAFRWNPPTDMGAERDVATPDPKAGASKPSDAPREKMTADEVDKEIERLQGEVRRFMRTNGLKPYHFDALMLSDKELPDSVREFRLKEWQHVVMICERKKLRWDDAMKVMAKEYPTSPERLELLDELVQRHGGDLTRPDRILIESAKNAGYADAIEWWIDKLAPKATTP